MCKGNRKVTREREDGESSEEISVGIIVGETRRRGKVKKDR